MAGSVAPRCLLWPTVGTQIRPDRARPRPAANRPQCPALAAPRPGDHGVWWPEWEGSSGLPMLRWAAQGTGEKSALGECNRGRSSHGVDGEVAASISRMRSRQALAAANRSRSSRTIWSFVTAIPVRLIFVMVDDRPFCCRRVRVPRPCATAFLASAKPSSCSQLGEIVCHFLKASFCASQVLVTSIATCSQTLPRTGSAIGSTARSVWSIKRSAQYASVIESSRSSVA